MKMSPFDLVTAILRGGKIDQSSMLSDSGKTLSPTVAMLLENRELMMILTTSVAVLIGCVVVLFWRRQRSAKPIEQPKWVAPKIEEEPEVDDGKKKVTIFYGTQTGTAEGFAKVYGVFTLFLFGL